MSKREETIISYKGFDANLQCRGFQYEVGKEYEHEGNVEVCSSGFHACEYPLDVFNYYPPSGSRFAAVQQSGKLIRHEDDSKVASQKISISAELTLPGIIKAAIEYTFSRCKPVDPGSPASSTGNRGAASSTGDYGAASSTGYQGAASSTGYQGAASSTGYRGAASSTGDRGAASSTGARSVAMACGIEGKAMAGETGAIVLVFRGEDGEIIHIRASKVGENGIKPGVWYSLDEHGEFVEAA